MRTDGGRANFNFVLRTLLVSLVVVAVPFSLYVDIEHGSRTLRSIKLPFADLFIWISTAIFLTQSCWQAHRRKQKRTVHPTEGFLHTFVRAGAPELWLFVLVAGLSISSMTLLTRGLNELIQSIDYYILWFWVVALWSTDARAARAALALVTFFLVCVVGVALLQVFSDTPGYLVRSLYRDQRTHMTAFILLSPLAWSGSTGLRSPLTALAYVCVGVGAVVVGSLVGTVIVLALLILAARLLGRGWLRRSLLIVGIAVLTFGLVPRDYRAELFRDASQLFRTSLESTRRQVLLVKEGLESPRPQNNFGVGPWRVFIGQDLATWREPFARPHESVRDGEPIVVQEYWVESWSALSLIAEGSLFGSGLGSWQETMATRSETAPRTGTLIPNSTNGYLLIGVTMGLMGLLAWSLALTRTTARVLSGLRRATGELDRALLVGSAVGLIGGVIGLFFCPFAIQPVAVYWVFLAAVTRHGIRPGNPS